MEATINVARSFAEEIAITLQEAPYPCYPNTPILRQEVSDLRRVVQRTEPVEPVMLSISGSPSPFRKHTRFTVIPNDTKVIKSDHTKLSAVLEDIGNRFFENRPWDKAFLEGFAQELEKFANDVSRHVRRRFRVDKTVGWQSSPKEGRDLAVDMMEANVGDYFPLRSCKKSWATKFLLRRAWNRTCKEDANEGDILMNESSNSEPALTLNTTTNSATQQHGVDDEIWDIPNLDPKEN
ncbi:hypothetical protein BDA99DRAFT_587699 [Phascolomyces articulosus]|uniref:Uncharacterized protein n=1 Tax=Phascolomyces articulosus TaxID=60185 RepID=A0AAD5PAS5_9FUNG|nr:hypothetical protein BDA99DRAFT_587699 [Phascolomyces articulosus]